MTSGFIGCLRDFRLKGKRIGKWSNNHRSGVKPCSEKVETGTFIGPEGGFIHAFKKFRVGLDFDITMKIKPRKGILNFTASSFEQKFAHTGTPPASSSPSRAGRTS